MGHRDTIGGLASRRTTEGQQFSLTWVRHCIFPFVQPLRTELVQTQGEQTFFLKGLPAPLGQTREVGARQRWRPSPWGGYFPILTNGTAESRLFTVHLDPQETTRRFSGFCTQTGSRLAVECLATPG